MVSRLVPLSFGTTAAPCLSVSKVLAEGWVYSSAHHCRVLSRSCFPSLLVGYRHVMSNLQFLGCWARLSAPPSPFSSSPIYSTHHPHSESARPASVRTQLGKIPDTPDTSAPPHHTPHFALTHPPSPPSRMLVPTDPSPLAHIPDLYTAAPHESVEG